MKTSNWLKIQSYLIQKQKEGKKVSDQQVFNNAEEAFLYYYGKVQNVGISYDNTLALFNEGFYILNPLDNHININFRKWNKSYAEYEWEWYLSKNRSVEDIKKRAKIWDKMHNGDNLVQSNYGWQWSRNSQIDKVISILNNKKDTRKAVLSIYDGKEIDNYSHDTPCTLSIHFQRIDNYLTMSVNMRSNDLWYGFCNDQYCFSKLQEKIALSLNLKVGYYYHFASNLHLYNNKIKLS